MAGGAKAGPPQGEDSASLRSFRDPGGHILIEADRVLRIINEQGAAGLRDFLSTGAAAEFLAEGRLIPTEFLTNSGGLAAPGALVAEHEEVFFPSYPYEWAPEMLNAAAELTLDVAERSLRDGYCLKDATPTNVLFRGPRPVFVDVLSFERRVPGDPTWLPYAQFVRTFLLPLLACKHQHRRLEQIFLTSREGLEAEEVYGQISWLRRLLPPYLTLVSIPAWLGSRQKRDDAKIYQQRRVDDPEKARFILERLLKSLRSGLRRAAPARGGKSDWCDYMSTNTYSDDGFSAKERFCGEALDAVSPSSVLDIGSNTGHFSVQAARSGAKVVSIDYDPVVIGSLWRVASRENLDILPLAVNLAKPTPATGWRNRECSGFLDRARGKFDVVLMLAVVHHLLVTERVPLDEVLALASEITRDALVIEYVAPDDPMFKVLVRGREELHRDLSRESFESACLRRFTIERRQHLDGGTRDLYLLRKRGNR